MDQQEDHPQQPDVGDTEPQDGRDLGPGFSPEGVLHLLVRPILNLTWEIDVYHVGPLYIRALFLGPLTLSSVILRALFLHLNGRREEGN